MYMSCYSLQMIISEIWLVMYIHGIVFGLSMLHTELKRFKSCISQCICVNSFC